MIATIARVAAGIPTGGQFAAHDRADADIDLVVAPSPVDEALNPDTGEARLLELAAEDNWLVSRHVARHPNATAAVLAMTATSDDTSVRVPTALNTRIDLDTQTQLCRSRVTDVLVALASNPSLHPSVQRELARGRDIHAHVKLADHPHLDRGARTLLANGPSARAREILAARPPQY